MSTEASSTSKRKPTEELEAIVSSDNYGDDDQSKSKARRVSTDASASTNGVPVITEATSASEEGEAASNAQQDESIISIGALVQDLLHSDDAKFNAALDALNLDLGEDKKGKALSMLEDILPLFSQ